MGIFTIVGSEVEVMEEEEGLGWVGPPAAEEGELGRGGMSRRVWGLM